MSCSTIFLCSYVTRILLWNDILLSLRPDTSYVIQYIASMFFSYITHLHNCHTTMFWRRLDSSIKDHFLKAQRRLAFFGGLSNMAYGGITRQVGLYMSWSREKWRRKVKHISRPENGLVMTDHKWFTFAQARPHVKNVCSNHNFNTSQTPFDL